VTACDSGAVNVWDWQGDGMDLAQQLTEHDNVVRAPDVRARACARQMRVRACAGVGLRVLVADTCQRRRSFLHAGAVTPGWPI